MALRQQLMVFRRRNSRPNVGWPDKFFWAIARRLWSEWKRALVIVTPETVVRWHRTGFRLYWSWLSRHRRVFGRKRISKKLRELIFRMVAENPTWGAPRIHGELLNLDVNGGVCLEHLRRLRQHELDSGPGLVLEGIGERTGSQRRDNRQVPLVE